MPRGGRRLGSPSTPYSNRTDLAAQPVRTATGQPYGDAAAQAQTQKQMPLAGQPSPLALPAGQPQMVQGPPPIPPGGLGLYDPSNFPNEPVHAGLPTGPGPGPSIGQMTDADLVAAIARKFNTPGLWRMAQNLGQGIG